MLATLCGTCTIARGRASKGRLLARRSELASLNINERRSLYDDLNAQRFCPRAAQDRTCSVVDRPVQHGRQGGRQRCSTQQHGDVVAGRKTKLIVKDDNTAPDQARRIAQELIANDKVAIIGAGITPSALAIAPFVTEAKIPTIVMASGASITIDRSPYMVRTSFTLGQSSTVMADWVVQNGAHRIVTMVNDWAPELESEAAFKDRVAKGSAQLVESLRIPLANPDFASFLQRARDLGPDTLFVFPANPGRHLRQAVLGARHGQVRH
jgi:hypothetical protein